MKVVFDVMGAPDQSGGMNLYAVEVVRAWHEVAGGDQLIVIGGTWATAAFRDLDTVRVRTAPDRGIVGRSLTQLFGTALVYWLSRSDVVISASPIVTPLVPRSARMCVVHDWRHVKNPQEFSRAQRLYRQLWSASVRWAGCVAVISRKTGAETQAINPGARPVVVENGRDHPRRWGAVGRTGGPPALVTFGHHPNKRPEMVIDALSDSAELRHADATLTVLGARGDYATALRGRAEAAGIGDAVKLPGFVEPATYEATIAGADVVVLASSDEGFGLPVAEAQFFGVPVVVASDSGLDDIHRGLIVSAPDPERLSSALELAVGQGVQPGARDIRTWAQTARELRVLAARLLDRAARDEAEAVS